MLTAQDCRRNADELQQAADRLHLRSHRERYEAVAAEWRALAEAINANAASPIHAEDQTAREAALRAAAAQALDSPLRRALTNIAEGWAALTPAPPPPPLPPAET